MAAAHRQYGGKGTYCHLETVFPPGGFKCWTRHTRNEGLFPLLSQVVNFLLRAVFQIQAARSGPVDHDALRLVSARPAAVVPVRQHTGSSESGKRCAAPWLAADCGPRVRQVTTHTHNKRRSIV